MKENKGKIILSSALVLFPMVIGLLLWNVLPQQIVTHWGADGAADGWGSKAFAIIGMPLLMFGMHFLCAFLALRVSKNTAQKGKVLEMLFWTCPIISVVVNLVKYSVALGMDINVRLLMPVVLGIVFVIMGYYLPNCTSNSMISIKVEWTLNDDENWTLTHRFGGIIWQVCGFLLIIMEYLAGSVGEILFPMVLLVIVFAPVIYSYVLFKQKLKAGLTLKKRRKNPFWKSVGVLMGLTALGEVMLLLIAGDVTVSYNDTTFLVDASYWNDLEIPYADVDAIEYRESCVTGSRVAGFGSMRLALGNFKNDEFGNYTRYSYVGNDSCVVLTIDEKLLVLSGQDAENTKVIYEKLLKRVVDN